MLRYLQSRIRGTASAGPGAPPPGLIAFYWHFVRQTKGWYALMFATSLAVALIDTVIPVFIGKLVSLMEAVDRHAALAQQMPMLLGMAMLMLIVRPLVLFTDIAIRQNALIPGATSLIRWQSHWHVVRQGLTFFQNDFAGRIANRVMQTANALRESVMSSIRAVWYIAVYGISALWRIATSRNRASGRTSRIRPIMPTSMGSCCASAAWRSAASIIDTRLPMNTGITVSIRATARLVTNMSAYQPLVWRTKCQ